MSTSGARATSADNTEPQPLAERDAVAAFIQRWQDTGGKERSNYQLFLTELCQLLALPGPQPAGEEDQHDAYVFERRVDIQHSDGTQSRGYIDLYKRGHFVLEAKHVSDAPETSGWDKAMLRAANQADSYIRALPAKEGRPPFLLTCDVGKTIEVYAEFTCTGATYVPFPDPRSHRIHLHDLHHARIQHRLAQIWTNPDALDPAKAAARVTRELSKTLAQLARALEADGYAVERVAHFIKRCLFTMFAEDVGLLPDQQFTALLEKLQATPQHFAKAIGSLWETMNSGGYSVALNAELLRFNGNLFTEINPIPLDADQIALLIDAARHDWSQVEPAIFGTLLERALDPDERHKLGAHYTPRFYVERLVMPTVIDPLREQWRTVQAAAATLEQQGKTQQAVNELRQFHRQLCTTRILDPACGSGNFLYVTLEHMKRLEGEVLGTLADLSAGQDEFDTAGLTVDPHQFLGLEINPRAAAIAEMVLWIGYLQWHFRTYGHVNPPQPVLRAFDNIQCRDAVLAYESWEYLSDEHGRPIMRWDGKTWKKSPTTGEDIPEESVQVPEERYNQPRQAVWPETDYVVGNPPFIGAASMRRALGDGYVDALRQVWKQQVPESADFVMYWWNLAAELLRSGNIQQFGLITTNSLRQTFNRRVIERHMQDKKPLSLRFAIPDHPWVDASEAASVRIAMTVAAAGEQPGVLGQIVLEQKSDEEAREIEFSWSIGKIHANLAVGADTSSVTPLQSNSELTSRGVMLFGSGFILEPDVADKFAADNKIRALNHIRPYLNGRDLTQRPRGVFVIDLFGLEIDDVRSDLPAIYQWILERVKPERDQNRDAAIRKNWWLHGRPRPELRGYLTGLERYITTVETSKHRFFQFLDKAILPDNMLVNIATDKAAHQGVLSSRIHVNWALALGGDLGGNTPRYNKTRCFETFPFPDTEEANSRRIANLSEQLDAHRKRQQAEHPGLTLTGMYNVLEKLRRLHVSGSDEPALTDKDKQIHEQGLVSVLRELHDELDRAVFDAYGWDDLADQLVGQPGATTTWPEKPEAQQQAEEKLLQRLVDLNHQRAAEEAQGKVRWLRPDYQAPDAEQQQANPEQTSLASNNTQPAESPGAINIASITWPKTLQAQIQAIRTQLASTPMDASTLSARFKRKPHKAISEVLSALIDLGMVRLDGQGLYRLREG